MTVDASSHFIEVHELTRQFPAVRALDGVTLGFRAGEIHGIIGENGAGKSTLMKILSGVERPTAGRIVLNGKDITLKHAVDAQRLGIAMIHQELNLVEELIVADNIFLGREKTVFGWVKRGETHAAAKKLLVQVDARFSPGDRVSSLSIAEKQLVEIAKALSTEARLLIMDEPTAVLTAREKTALFTLIQQLKSRGVTIIYISHILPEVLGVCDRITVLRDGRVVTTLDEERMKRATERELASLMVGRPMADHFPKRAEAGQGKALEVRSLSVPGYVDGVNFEVRRGEIFGFAGLIGAGRTEMAEAIMGLRSKSAGTISIDAERVYVRSPQDAVKAGIAYLSEDRKGAGLTLGMGIAENTTLLSLRRYCRPLISYRAENAATREHVKNLRIKIGGVRDPIDTLSGGNQQKVALAKWLEMSPKVLIIDEPTRGVDIGAKEEIYALLHRLVQQGMACVLISSEMNEVLGLSHRIAVMRDGRIEAVLDASEATEQQIMNHAAGVANV